MAGRTGDQRRPIVFIGPSMSVADARSFLDADYRPPIRRGDLRGIEAGTTVGVIDGVFDQALAVSPREMQVAADAGVRLVGSSSMGALRAAEVPAMVGIGGVYEMYRTERISRDDEVALLFDPQTFAAVTVPRVNVRFAVERLRSSGTLSVDVAEAILTAAESMHYRDLTYPAILRAAGLADKSDLDELCALLERFDLKRDDAQLLLERLPELAGSFEPRPARSESSSDRFDYSDFSGVDGFGAVRVGRSERADAPVLLWESGDLVPFDRLLSFLAMTGLLPFHARNAVARYVLEGNDLDDAPREGDAPDAGHRARLLQILQDVRQEWGWVTSEEFHVTMRDLAMAFDDLAEACGEEVAAREAVARVVRSASAEFHKSLRAELLMTDLALKREALRAASLAYFAARGHADGPPTPSELEAARRVVCRHHRAAYWGEVARAVAPFGVERDEIDRFARELALARRAARALCQSMGSGPKRDGAIESAVTLRSSPKAPGDARFCTRVDESRRHAEQLRSVIGVTRVGMIGELSDLGVHVSQAARPTSKWSSTYGSGKAETVDGAFVGGVMEEVEKWAHERFEPPADSLVASAYEDLRDAHLALDPATLELPWDSCYREDLEIQWIRCADLLSPDEIYVPLALLEVRRLKDDIMYTPRGSRKIFLTNGLASGFTREEALLHAACEFVERHALRIAELYLTNPGGLGDVPYPLVDLDSCRPQLGELFDKLEPADNELFVLDITSEVAVPTFQAVIVDERTTYPGWAAHPNPVVAVKMALLEAAQTKIGNIAGGREDLAIQARSLGRHERARPERREPNTPWLNPDHPRISLADIPGLVADDALDDLMFVLQCLRGAGVEHVAALDLSREEAAPAHVIRVIIPQLETNNPFYMGPRARLAVLRDLVPQHRRRIAR